MPQRKIAKKAKLNLKDIPAYIARDRNKIRANKINTIQTRIKESPYKSAIIPYLIRGILDYQEKKRLTQLQSKIVKPFIETKIDKKILRQFKSLPNNVKKEFDQEFFKLPRGTDVDKKLKKILRNAAAEINKHVDRYPDKELHLKSGFSDIVIPYDVVKLAKFGKYIPQINPCPDVYRLRLEYTGISTLDTADRSDGVEPYLITGFYSIPKNTNKIVELSKPIKIKAPEDLGVCGNLNTWYPQEPPSQFHPIVYQEISIPWGTITVRTRCAVNEAPIISADDVNFAIVSVWEEDGDQAEQIMRYMSSVALNVGTALLEAVPVAGIIIIVIAALLEIGSYLTGSADDYIGDIVLYFDKATLDIQGWHETSGHVDEPGGNNDWVLWFGIESKKVNNT
jgi:hypothetical protein